MRGITQGGAPFDPAGGFGLWARAFALGSLVHLTLPDFEGAGWTPPAVVGAVGAVALLVRPGVLGFAASAVSSLWTLLFLRDVLTQSALLTGMALVGALAVGFDRRRAGLDAVRWLTAGTYGLAALHKLNANFFDPSISCATHAWDVMVARWPVLPADPAFAPALAWATVAVEVAIAVGAARRAPWVWPLALVFHLPLTATLAPAFEAVMLAGLAATLTPRQRARARRVWRTEKRWLALGAVVVGGLDVAAAGGVPSVAVLVKLMATGALFAGALRVGGWADPRPRGTHPVAWPALALWVLNGLTPYLGLQYQHSAAMLSNLRVDQGCHNSYVVPEALRLRDPYIRIDEARFGDGLRPKRAAVVRDTLWHVAALHTMRRNWCVDHLRPIRFAGTWLGQPFEIPDLCAQGWLSALPGASRYPAGLQLFQKNLRRGCKVACVH